MDVRETLRQAVEMGASDIFIIAGLPLTYKAVSYTHLDVYKRQVKYLPCCLCRRRLRNV